MTHVYTIGHSNHDWGLFYRLLKPQGIQTLVDVRSKPVSRHASFANKRKLPALLEQEGIGHVHFGDSLGAKPSDPSLYDAEGAPDYEKIAATPAFSEGVEELAELAGETVVAMMCAEEDPEKCHRRLLIGPPLLDQGIGLRHIRKDGSVQVEGSI